MLPHTWRQNELIVPLLFRANDAGLLALYQSVHLNRHFVGIIAQSLADVNVRTKNQLFSSYSN